MSVSSVRDRRRAETVAEIKEAALRELLDAGPGGFSLRGVARAVGMTVQSLYHYFANRDALLTALVVDAHHSAADAVQAAADTTRGRHPHERRLAACQAFREWALANRPAFLLLYGTPVPGFTPLAESDVGQAAWRLGQSFAEVVFDGWTPAQLGAVPAAPGLVEADLGKMAGKMALPLGAAALFIELRARMHGLVALEIVGHLHPFNEHGAAFFEAAINRMSADVDAVQRDTGR
ncbi:MAG TPA: TetR/AcrR family transcriptional regulator [Pseudonocardia sp.]|nr:TetR/AcrR family transcriptional regulator [Pseudonocardia sp.]